MKWMKEHDVPLRVLALLIALLTWMYVIRQQNPDTTETYSGIALDFDGIQQLSDNGLVITSGADTTVTVRFSGKRDRFLLLSRDKVSATVNVASITAPGVFSLNYTVSSEVEGISLSTKSPARISITVDRIDSRAIPIRIEQTGTMTAGYELTSVSLDPDAIGVSGPSAALDEVSYAAVTFDVTGRTASGETTLAYTLMREDGTPADVSRLTVDTPSTALHYTITRSGSVPLVVSFEDSEYLSSGMIEYAISPASILVSGSEDAVALVNHIDLGVISLRSVFEENLTTVEMPIILPNGVTEVAGQPTTATVTIAIPGYARTGFILPSEQLPELPQIEWPEQTLELSLFGREEALSRLTADDFTLTPQYREEALVEGENVILVAVTTDVEGVHVLGSYSALLIYTPPAPEPEPEPEA